MKLEDSIQRLRRFGNEDSPTVSKLREAAWFLAQHVCAQAVDAKVSVLPRSYCVRDGTLIKTLGLRGRGEVAFTAEMALSEITLLAQDVASGWLDEVRDALHRTNSR